MNKSRNVIIASSMLFAAFMLAGCKEKVYAVEYYTSNPAEAAKTIEQCRKGEITDQNCDNARTALEQIKKEEYKKKLRETFR
ncbi:TPA: EexN family lipoprotein [Escherichia coli]|nr:EexN family lipoprotein [Salmonella enterica subsp. enterica serovar Newport]